MSTNKVLFLVDASSASQLATAATHSISLLHEVLPTDVSHNAGGQSVTHNVHHCAESISTGGGEKNKKQKPKSYFKKSLT